jgi:hypothetical protein
VGQWKREIVGWRIACGCSLLSIAGLLLGLSSMRSTERIWVLPGSGGVYAGPLERLDQSVSFFNESALLASQCALQWSSAGFDLPELLHVYFHPKAVAALQTSLDTRMPDIRKRSLNAKPLIQSVSEPISAAGARIVEVRGVLAISGQFAGRLIYEEPTFKLSLRFSRNLDLGQASRYPWIVADVSLEMEDAS